MRRLLHIIATPREEDSRTLQIAGAFLDAFTEKHPEWIVDELNLAKEDLPSLSLKQVSGKYILLDGKDLYGRLKESWADTLQHIDRFKMADLYLVSSPMWNFHIPYMLKHYIDLIVQPKYLFRYVEGGGCEGLIKNKKMVVATSRGGRYEEDAKAYDFQEPYLRHIFGFVGITDIHFINAEPMDMGAELRKQKMMEAANAAAELGRTIDA